MRPANPSEWIDCPAGRDGIELLHASLDRHVYDRHIHESYAIGVTLRGVQRFWCRGAVNDSRPGDAIVIPPGEVHDGRSGSARGYAYRMFYVRRDVFESFVEDASDGAAARVAVPRPVLFDPAVSRQLDVAWAAVAGAPASLAADELFLRSVAALVRRHFGVAPAPQSSPYAQVLERVREYLHDRVARAVTMRELSAVASMSRFRLTRHFQRQYGLPLHAYHLHLRLEEAKRRLRLGQPIAQVAADLQFVDQSHFHRRFRGAFAMTPGQWRAAHGYKTAAATASYPRREGDNDDAGRHGHHTVRRGE